MDWEEVVKHSDACLDKRISAISAVLQTNRAQVNKLITLCENLDKHLKSAKTHAKKESESSKPEIGFKSPAGKKDGKEEKKKTEEEEKKEGLKKSESKLSVKKSVDLNEKNEGLKKSESKISFKKPADSEEKTIHKKPSPKPENRKEDKPLEGKGKIPKFVGKSPKKQEEEEKNLEDRKKIPKPVGKSPKKPEEEDKAKKPGKAKDFLKKEEQKNKEKPVELPEKEEENGDDLFEINLTPKPFALSESKIELIKKESSSKLLNNYVVSLGVQISIHGLNKLSSEKFYLIKDNPRAEFLWLFKVLFVLLGKDFTDESFWLVLKEFLTGGKGNRVLRDIGGVILSLSNEFDFSYGVLEKLLTMTHGVEIDIQKFGKHCEVSGTLAYLIKEVLAFAGLETLERGE